MGAAAASETQPRVEDVKAKGEKFAADLGGIFERILLENALREAFKIKDELVGSLGEKEFFGYKLQGSVSEFRQRQSRFFNTLLTAARLDQKDSRLRALAQWGQETKVIIPGESAFGEPILSRSQRDDLSLD